MYFYGVNKLLLLLLLLLLFSIATGLERLKSNSVSPKIRTLRF